MEHKKPFGTYKDPEIYQLAHQLGVDIQEFGVCLPKFQHFDTGSQLHRASKSVIINVTTITFAANKDVPSRHEQPIYHGNIEDRDVFPGRETTARKKGAIALAESSFGALPTGGIEPVVSKNTAQRAASFCLMAVSRSGRKRVGSVLSVSLW